VLGDAEKVKTNLPLKAKNLINFFEVREDFLNMLNKVSRGAQRQMINKGVIKN